MRTKINIFFVFFTVLLPIVGKSQCMEYMKSIASESLFPYVVDGNFYAPVVYEGDEIEMTRTFLEGHRYKIAVVGMNFFQKKITISNQNGNVVFSNFNFGKSVKRTFNDYDGYEVECAGSNYWEFEPSESMNLVIHVEIEKKAKRKKSRLQGCIGVIVGYLE